MKHSPKIGLVHVKCKTKYFDYVMNRNKEELRSWAARMDSDINSVNKLTDQFDLIKRPTKEQCFKLISEIEAILSKWR